MEDKQIVALFYARSEDALAQLADKYGAMCLKMANNILNDRRDAEECVNDAYLGAWNTIPPQNPNPLCSYICRIVRNLAITKYHANRAAKRNSSLDTALDELENCLASGESVEDRFDVRETAMAVNEFLEALDRESRVLFVRRYWQADSIADLAALFDTSSHNISVRLHRIREKLKKYLIRKGVTL